MTDSIAAVEAAWGKVATDIGQDPAYVIAATHGKRAVDNLAQFKPHIKAHEMDDEVTAFEETILFFADAYNKHGPGSRNNSPASYSPASSASDTPELTPANSATSSAAVSRTSSFAGSLALNQLNAFRHRPSFASRVSRLLTMSSVREDELREFDDPVMEEVQQEFVAEEQAKQKLVTHALQAWQIEATAVDRSVKILPGVKNMIASIPEGHYAVATSGAKTYGASCSTHFILDAAANSFSSSLRLHDPCWYHPAQGDHHCRRQEAQGRQARARPLPAGREGARLRREEVRRLRGLTIRHSRWCREWCDCHRGLH